MLILVLYCIGIISGVGIDVVLILLLVLVLVLVLVLITEIKCTSGAIPHVRGH